MFFECFAVRLKCCSALVVGEPVLSRGIAHLVGSDVAHCTGHGTQVFVDCPRNYGPEPCKEHMRHNIDLAIKLVDPILLAPSLVI